MKFWGLIAIIVVGVFAFVVGQRLSADAVGMAVGVLFGVLAGIPAALLMVAAGRRREAEFEDDDDELPDTYAPRRGRGQPAYGAIPAQAPVIVFAPPAATPPGAPYAGYSNQYVAPQPPTAAQPRALTGPTTMPTDARRAFKVVGEQEEWITEW